jgi:hypothetical protein
MSIFLGVSTNYFDFPAPLLLVQIDAGIIWVNDHHKNDPSSPWGGTKKASGIGRENGVDAYNEYTQSKSIIVNTETYKDDWWNGRARPYRSLPPLFFITVATAVINLSFPSPNPQIHTLPAPGFPFSIYLSI